MKVMLPDGTAVECTTDELIELKSKGFLERDKQYEDEVRIKRLSNAVKEVQKRNNSLRFKTRQVGLKHKWFSRHENKVIKEVWNKRKNLIRLTNREYNLLEKQLPGRNRKAIGARIAKMKRIGKLK